MSVPYGPLLVVEDVPNILELLELTLQFKGYPVITATNGQEGLEKVAQERPALVITDILMPRLNGYAMVQKLRTNPKTCRIPIIFLSATYVTAEDKAFAMSLGAVRFLEKPVDTEEFLLTIAEVLTMGPPSMPAPLGEREFYKGYRERLETKLRHKNQQIARTERLLETLPGEQRSAFKTLLEDARYERTEIQSELNELYRLLEQYKVGA
jgi:CheY-like chemotaxis protein